MVKIGEHNTLLRVHKFPPAFLVFALISKVTTDDWLEDVACLRRLGFSNWRSDVFTLEVSD